MISMKIDLQLEFYKYCSGIMTECNNAWPTASFSYGIKHSQDAHYVQQVASSSQEFHKYQLPPNVKNHSPGTLRQHEDISYFVLLAGKSQEVTKCFRLKLLPPVIQSRKFGPSMDSFIFTMQPAILYNL